MNFGNDFTHAAGILYNYFLYVTYKTYKNMVAEQKQPLPNNGDADKRDWLL